MAFAIIYDKATGKIRRVVAGISDKSELNLDLSQDAIITDRPPKTIGNDKKVVNGEIVDDDDMMLIYAKEAKKSEIENEYERRLGEPFEYNGHLFHGDKKSRDILTEVITAATPDFTTRWRDINKQWLDVTLDDLKAMSNILLIRGQQLYMTKADLKSQVDAATTIDEVNQIKWE